MKKLGVVTLMVTIFFAITAYGWSELYVVKPHDTLWGISKKFYKKPTLWGKLWCNNLYINDPYLIFPGEILKVTEHGLKLYNWSQRRKSKVREGYSKNFVSAIWFDRNNFYSTCENELCVWKKRDFEVAKLSFDTYNHIEVQQGDIVYLYSAKILPDRVYVYRKLKDLSLDGGGFDAVFMPIGEIKVLGLVKKGVYKARIESSPFEIAKTDVISTVYPYDVIHKKPKLDKLGNVKVKEIFITQNELQSGLGFLIFFKAEKPLSPLIGKKVILARLNEGSPEPISIGEGIVTSQYKSYLGIFFSAIGGLKDVPDRTQEYVLR